MKKQERLENKKRKLSALANLITSEEKEDGNHEKPDEAEQAEKNSLSNSDLHEEPLIKKMRTYSGASSDVQYANNRKSVAQWKNAKKNVPKFRLKFFGEKASLLTNESNRQPLMLDDIQYLLMSALLGSNTPFRPDRWCVLEKINKVSHTVVLVIEGLTSYSFMSNESLFVETKSIFEQQLEVVLPKFQKNRIVEELSCVPLTQSHKEKLIQQYGSLEAAINLNKDHHLIAKSVFPIEGEIRDEDSMQLSVGETFPRTRLLLSPLQMMIEGYPMPLKGEYSDKCRGFKFTKDSYKPVTSTSPMFGLDCEMCRTVKAENELTRVSIVNENYESVYETLVRPANRITDYLTQFSGITKEKLEDVTQTLEDVQRDVKKLLPPDAILVGQSLNCDLNAMKLMHPYVIDTSCVFNISGDRNRKSKLQFLAKTFLGEAIQMDKDGHSSIEDSTASLKLTKLKLSKDIYFGDVALQQRKKVVENQSRTGIAQNELEKGSQSDQQVATSMLSQVYKRSKTSAIVTTHNSDLELGKFYSKSQLNSIQVSNGDSGVKHHKVTTPLDVITKTRKIIMDHDFNLSHFNILEDSIHDDGSPVTVAEENLTPLIPKIDNWINQLWKSVAINGLFVVIFGGHEQNTNGLSMVRIKH